MSKLIYPNDGIYRYCKNDAESCANTLLQAISDCNFDIPSGFVYKSHLSNLDNNIRSFYNEISNISSKILKIDHDYETLSSDLELSVKKMTVNKVKERDRMIF